MVAMPRKRSLYNAHAQAEEKSPQAVLDFDAPEPEPVAPVVEHIPESPPGYGVKTGWVDTMGKTRTWVLLEPSGAKLAEITTKNGASRVANLLNGNSEKQRGR